MDDDAQLNRILISLGAEEVKLKNLADGKVFTADAAQGDARTARDASRNSATSIRRHGGDFEEYLARARSRRPARFPPTWSRCARAIPSGSLTSPAKRRCASSTRRTATSNLFDDEASAEASGNGDSSRSNSVRAGGEAEETGRRSAPPRPPHRTARIPCRPKTRHRAGEERSSRSSTSPTATTRSSN